MTDNLPPEVRDLQTNLNAFLAIPDPATANRFADAHPELRDPNVVALLVYSASGSDDGGAAQELFAYALILCGMGWPDGPAVVTNVVTAVAILRESPFDRAVCDQAIEAARGAGQALGRSGLHPVLLARTLDIASGVLAQGHAATGDRALLDEAITLQRQAVRAVRTTGALNNLALRLADLYDVTGDWALLDEAITLQREVLHADPGAGPERPTILNNLAKYLSTLHHATGERALLDEAVNVQRQAVEATPTTSTERPRHLTNHAAGLVEMYRATGERALLDEAVDVQRQAVQAIPTNSNERPGILNGLAIRLHYLYEATGDRTFLDEAVEAQRQAVQATSTTSTQRPGRLNGLAVQLVHLYAATGERALLDEAVDVQRQAVEATPTTSTKWPGHLNNLANSLSHLYQATGDRSFLDEAVEMQRRAVQATPTTNAERSTVLNNLAQHLDDLHAVTGERALLDEAVEVQRRAVEATPATSTEWPGYLNNLALRLTGLYDTTGDRTFLDEAVEVQHEAVHAVPTTSTKRPTILNNLAMRLADLYAETGDHNLLDKAGELLARVPGGGPQEHVSLANTRAWLARVDERQRDRYKLAAEELTVALESYQDQLTRAGLSVKERRDLAQQSDGLLGDLAASHLLAGDVDGGLRLIEGDRIWLPAPGELTCELPEAPVAVAWVIPSRWETVVVTCTDHRGPHGLATHIVNKTRAQIRRVVATGLVSARWAGLKTPAAGHFSAAEEDIDALVALTSEIVAAFPPAERLLIVPLGISALLPYSAAESPDEAYLIDGTTITIAPSLVRARAARRQRPDGQSVGAFHPGNAPNRQLALDEDRRAFEELVSTRVLDRPTAEQVLAHFGPGTSIGHVSCHGSYNYLKPLESWLDLETALTIHAVLDHTTAPWLVNLSACETAIPDLDASEQQISFPTGFILGGATHVLSTLWPVSNIHATFVNRAFYQHLAQGEHPAEALRYAIGDLRNSGEPAATARMKRSPIVAKDQPSLASADFKHPFWWAPFTHHGSPW
jgi:tetratricopeptide (TPR) repeat protein